ncbi:MAG: hypothetical protein WDZ37_02375 [Solirubrobacterales bacterium]
MPRSALRRQGNVTVSSRVAAPRERVWARVVTPEGVNHELMPIMRMTVPRGLGSFDLERLPVGEPIGRSWILLGGLIPVDYDDLKLDRVDPGFGFLERSTMLTMRLWEHERTLSDQGDGCVVTDRLRFKPRLPLPIGLVERIVRAIFRHRHRRLLRWFDSDS